MSIQDKYSQNQIDRLKSGSYGKSFDDTYEKNILEKDKKEITYLDIDLLYPAPKSWNFFPELSESKMLEMMFSIMENGLFNPIIVWEQEEGCMILSGHNRVNLYARIIEEYGNSINFDKEKYETIPAIVFKKDEIDEDKAKEIIIDTNYIQRDEDKRLMPLIIKHRLDIVKNRKDIKGRTVDIVAKELGISSTKVYEDQLIANRIIPELNEFFFNNKLGKKSLLRFAWFDKKIQQWIYDNFKENIFDNNVMKLKKHMDKNAIKECFKEGKDERKMVTVTIRMLEEIKDEFREMALEWIENKEKEIKMLN